MRSLGSLAPPLLLAILFHLVLAFPRGRLQSRVSRGAVFAVYLLAIGVSVARALVRDPLLDLYCWRNCFDNSFLVHADPAVARTLDGIWLRSALAIGLVMVAVVVWRLVAASAAARRALWPGLVPGALAGAAEAAYAAALLHRSFENPRSMGFASIFLVRAGAVTSFALGLAWSVFRTRRTRAAVTSLAAELGDAPPPGKLRETLAAAVGDEQLEVVYPLDGSGGFVDGAGRPAAAPVAGNGRAVTSIARDGHVVALVAHDAALLDGSGLELEVGPAARLAVENERLQAEVLAQLENLRASRSRIVERGDAERRRLERDLHDGAQQRLLALSYDLRLARNGAETDGDAQLAARLDMAVAETQTALGELRDLAQGIYPVVLAEAGLAPALATLADTAPLPLDLDEVTTERFTTPVETAAYATIVDATRDAAARGAARVMVYANREGGRLVVEVRDDGAEHRSSLVHLADRIGALAGSLDMGRNGLRAEIPCA